MSALVDYSDSEIQEQPIKRVQVNPNAVEIES